MNKSSVVKNIREKYIDSNLENSKKINYSEVSEDTGLIKVLYKDLKDTEVNGYPFASDYISKDGKAYSVDEFNKLSKKEQAKCELRYYYLPNYHELYIGTTGSGKTTGCVEPQLRAISSQKNKPNLFLTDPKGELFDRNAEHLKEQGYELYVLNFKNLQNSHKWNPLLELYDLKMKIVNIGKNKKYRIGKVKKGLTLCAREEEFINEDYIEYDGRAFPDENIFKNYLAFERDYLEANIDSLLSQFANMMIKVQSKTDKSWEYGAQDLLKGILQCMLEEAADESSGFTREMMTLRTMQMYYLALKTPILNQDTTLHNHWLMKNKSDKPKALMATALANAGNTMRSYCGVFDGAVKDWFQGHIFALTTKDSINIDSIGDKPFAIFLITRDYEKSDFLIAGLFIDWVYRKMIERAEKDKNCRPLHFMLDEFGNIPEIKDLENKIATARSRNIWFHLVVQSYKQIDFIYGPERSVIIRDNCNAQIFLGAQNMETKEIFAGQCGKHYIPSLQSKLNFNDNSITEVPLIPVSQLDQITPGQMYVKRIYSPVITSQFIRSYVCANQGTFKYFNESNGLETCTPVEVESFTTSKYTFEKLVQGEEEEDIFSFKKKY